MKKKRILVIGGGINGLTHAFYMAREGFEVTVLERMPVVGGAGRNATMVIDEQPCTFPLGATLLGQMQDFVARDLRLAERIAMGASPHPSLYRFEGQQEPFFFHHDPEVFEAMIGRLGWDLHGLDAYENDLSSIVAYIQQGFHEGRLPSYSEAAVHFGPALTRLWITGSARDLLDHYLRDERLKVVMGKDVVESGPVSYREPGTAFSIPMLDAGSVFDGKWGYVQGGMGRLMEKVAEACCEQGVRIVTSARVTEVSLSQGTCRYLVDGNECIHDFDHVTFATDPMSAAGLIGDSLLTKIVSGKRYAGSSGKVIMLFNRPVRWKDDTGKPGFDACLKFFLRQGSIDELDRASRDVLENRASYVPGYSEMYCEGAGQRMLGGNPHYDGLMAFFKHLSCDLRGDEMDDVREQVIDEALRHTVDGRAHLRYARLLTPADLKVEFFFPGGCIDHMTLTGDQSGPHRRFSAPDSDRSYQFGVCENATYCGAGAYPCGSIAGTAGYMAATELLRTLRP